MDLNFPKSLSDFYKYTVFLVFAVVIAQSFTQSVELFTPYSKLATYSGIENVIVSVVVYVFILTSWIGYFLSITNDPHSETLSGTVRFALDLFMIYLFYYLLRISADFNSHKDIFTWIFPLIFITFLAWDIVKLIEFRHDSERGRIRINRTVITVLALAAILIQAECYVLVRPLLGPLVVGGNDVWNIVFIITTGIIVCSYRWRKRVTFRMRSKKSESS